jgi:hypothetical protein
MEASVGYIKTMYGAASVSKRLLGLYEPVPQTEEEKAATAVWAAEREAKALRQAARHLVLAASPSPLVAALADLHKPVPAYLSKRLQCIGCDADGYDSEPPEWPCRTWELLDKTAP